MKLAIFNTLSNSLEVFTPQDASHIKMYVCGPTVYERPHLGNARSIVFYDLFFRILQLLYPKVTFVRNITDVDDKIINQAHKEGISPLELTQKVISQFEEDTKALNCKTPTFEPKVTEFIPQIIKIIKQLVQNNNAYITEAGDVMFKVSSFAEYGKLSNRKLQDLISGTREITSEGKMHEHDFILWKASLGGELGWESEFSFGRPGWHIECSAMSTELLGMNFDIHGGGADLQFPHHENEIAQSECAFPHQKFANYWVHNGFLTINGEKMSKSLGNFKTVKNLLDEGFNGAEIRFALLNTHYRKPLSFTEHLMQTSRSAIKKFNQTFEKNLDLMGDIEKELRWTDLPLNAQDALLDNINISKFTAIMHGLVNDLKNTTDKKGRLELFNHFYKMGLLIGIF
jgi:cysteinyl-tRNA synthetase